ncbi:hypothetical protein K443DRAFT_640971 [Laccaria amethystina LaAM-08-1]|uniref:Uncharacterized protein n=1 Tax=Laccaria amethystina LaAM-08-1 TaxID=1095629 RepID=A0A0C9XAD5_9AGAR|nr:hypothetical protein K443DRAFT_640971 [Laccaria amethystina LaAM-08-1]
MFVGEGNVDGSKECSQAKGGLWSSEMRSRGPASLCSILDLLVSINLIKVPAPSTAVPLRLEATLLRRIFDATVTSSALLRLANEPFPLNFPYVNDG